MEGFLFAFGTALIAAGGYFCGQASMMKDRPDKERERLIPGLWAIGIGFFCLLAGLPS